MSFFNGKDEPEHGFTIEDLQKDAEKKIALLRAMLAEFVDEQHEEPLTRSEINTASRTPLVYLEESAAVCDAAPELPVPPRTVETLRLTRAANEVYRPVLELAEELTRRIRVAMSRKNLSAFSLARLVHRRAGLFLETGKGPRLRAHLEQLQRIPGRPWRRKPRRG